MKRFTTLLAALLAGCASFPHDAPQVAQVKPADVGLGTATATATIASDWWTAFGDPQLDRLITAGLSGNPSLAEADARVRAAQAEVSSRAAGRKPQLNASGQIDRARIGDKFLPPPIGGGDSAIEIAAANFSYDLDLFGRQRAAVRQARASAAASALDAASARLSLSVSIAQAYVALAGANRQVAVAEGFVQTRRRALGFAQVQVRDELASQFALRQAETLLAQAEEARTQALGQREVLVHAIAALAGRGVDFYPQVTAPTLALDRAPPVPALLPADLLGRRPDLLAGRARIEAAVQGRLVARDAFLPNVSISALVGLTAVGLGNFFTGGAFTYSVGPAINVPIFQGGRLRSRYRGATADLDAAVADYDDIVVGAVRDAADAITQVGTADQSLAEEGRVVQGFRETVRLDQVRVSTGLGSQLDSIDSGFRLLQAEQSLIQFQADALNRRIQLVAALGGGFDINRSPAAAATPDIRS